MKFMTKIHTNLTPMNFLPYAQLSPEFMDEYYPTEPEEPVEEVNPAQGEGPAEGEEILEDEPEV